MRDSASVLFNQQWATRSLHMVLSLRSAKQLARNGPSSAANSFASLPRCGRARTWANQGSRGAFRFVSLADFLEIDQLILNKSLKAKEFITMSRRVREILEQGGTEVYRSNSSE